MPPSTLELQVDERETAGEAVAESAVIDRRSRQAAQERRIRRTAWMVALLCAVLAVPVAVWAVRTTLRASPETERSASRHAQPGQGVRAAEPIQPITPLSNLNPAAVALGRRLFFDARLSADGSVSCASCHRLEAGGADGRRVSEGISGQLGGINAPTVYNSAFNFRQFWDGRAATLEEQIDGPIQNPVEMGATWEHVLKVIADDPKYEGQFLAAFGTGISRENVRKALAEFERRLTTPNARFDQWLRGDDSALTEQELSGYKKFKDFQCISCHQGINLGGSMYQRLGVMAEYFSRERELTPADMGRFNVTGDEQDRHVFRVPPLRNVALTAPYFHDGSAATLAEAVRVMIEDQLGRKVNERDVEEICAFLMTLTGELPEVSQ